MTSHKQDERQAYRNQGRYAKVNPCNGCGKSAGVDYFSHPMTDQAGSDGQPWGDTAICLCPRCLMATEHMTRVQDFLAYVCLQEAKLSPVFPLPARQAYLKKKEALHRRVFRK